MKQYVNDDNLKGKRKIFSQELFDKYDLPAREVIKNALKEFVADNTDIYMQDLIITDPEFKYKYIELQVCADWIGVNYPHDSVYVYERKHRYGDDTLFITLNKCMSKGFIFDAKSFKDLKPRRIKKYGREFVYDIPWNRIMPFIVSNLNIDLIKMY